MARKRKHVPDSGVERMKSFYVIEDAAPKKSVQTSPGSESPLTRWRRRSLPAHPDMRGELTEVATKRGWDKPLGGIHDRLDRLSQVLLSGERSRPLKRRFLLLAVVLAAFYAWVLRATLRDQYQSWVKHPGSAIGLTGIDGSIVVPVLVTFWYVLICQVLVRVMAALPPAETVIFELAVIYNVLQAGMNAYVAVMMLHEARTLNLKLVGNAAPTHAPQDHRLGMIAILHYHLRILELCDTFFLILRKKLYRDSLHLHGILRMQNVWGWHIACRLGCGGDIYFPVVTNALCSTFLHVHYALALVEPHADPLPWLLRRCALFTGSLTSLRRSIVQVVQVCCFQLSLMYGLLSFCAGSYPRLVLVVNVVQCCFGILLYSDFHYRSDKKPVQPEEDNGHEAKLAFSFDSSGWCYFYHFGVAMWIQEHFAEEIANGDLAFSGSSGGAIVGAALATGIDIPTVLDSVINRTWHNARKKPTKIPEEVQYTLEQFCPMDGHKLATNRLRVLMTRVMWRPPFFMGEVATEFRSREHLFDLLQASSSIPGLFGWGKHVDGTRYLDGMFWPSLLVPWRSFKSQSVCRVSCFSTFNSDIGPHWSAIPPIWWPIYPPSQEALEGFFWAGYRDIAAAFGSPDGRTSGCSMCARRQLGATLGNPPRLCASSSQTIDELILVYERTARRDWALFLGFFIILTVVSYLAWLHNLVWHSLETFLCLSSEDFPVFLLFC